MTHNFPSCGGGDDPRREGRKRKSLPRQAFCANIIHGFFVDRAYLYWSKCQSAGRPSLSLELHSTIWTSTQNIFLPGISLNNVIGGSFRSGPTHKTATPLGRSPKKHSLAGKGERVRRPSLHSLSSPLAAREAGAEGGKKEGWVFVRYACVREKESYTFEYWGGRKKVFVCHRGWVIPQCGILGTGGGGEKRGGG